MKHIHRRLRISESLFCPSLKLRWQYEGRAVSLKQRNKTIWRWESIGDYWCMGIGVRHLDAALMLYLDQPLDELRKRNTGSTRILRMFLDANVQLLELRDILLASDRRLGRDLQSRWVFGATQCGVARTLAASRL